MKDHQETKKPQDDWRLEKIELEFKSYGENKGKYEGRIRFQNGEFESFSFKIRPEMAQPYISIMSEDIVKCAESLASRLIDSLGLQK
jgi:hypothetical protein